MNSKQRSTRAERMAAKEVLKSLWERAFAVGLVEINYLTDYEKGGFPSIEHAQAAGKKLHQALGDFRKEIRKKATSNTELLILINGIMLLKEEKGAVVKLQRKPAAQSERTSLILNAASKVDGLVDSMKPSDPINDIMNNFSNH